jgi:hypothetical protein
VLSRLVPLAESSVTGKAIVIDDALKADMMSLLAAIQHKAGIGLKVAIFKARMDLQSGRLPFSNDENLHEPVTYCVELHEE